MASPPRLDKTPRPIEVQLTITLTVTHMSDKYSPSSSAVWREHHGPTASMIKRTNAPKVPRPKRYPCPGCDRLFDRPSTLSLHILTHTGERPHPCPLCLIRPFATVSNLNRHMKTCRGYASPSSSESSPDPASLGALATTPTDPSDQELSEINPIGMDTYRAASTPTLVPQLSLPLPPPTPTDPFANVPYGSSFYRQLSSLSHWNAYEVADRSAQLQPLPPNQDGHASSSSPHSMAPYDGGQASRSLENNQAEYWSWQPYTPPPPPLSSHQPRLPSHIVPLYNHQQLIYPVHDLSTSSLCTPIQMPPQMMTTDARTSSPVYASNRFNHMREEDSSGVQQSPVAYMHLNNNSFYSLSSARDEEHGLLKNHPGHHHVQNHQQNSRSTSGAMYGVTDLSFFAVKEEDRDVWSPSPPRMVHMETAGTVVKPASRPSTPARGSPFFNNLFSDNLPSSKNLFKSAPLSAGALTMSIAQLCEYLSSTPSGQILSLVRHKETHGVKHEFLVMRVRGPSGLNLWLRVERAAKRAQSGIRSLFSTFPAKDTARICGSEKEILYEEEPSTVEAEVHFGSPPTLLDLEKLLTIVTEESVDYKLWPENCFFFAAAVQENLLARHGGYLFGKQGLKNLAQAVRTRIRARFEES